MGLDERQTYVIPISRMFDVPIGTGYSLKIRAVNFFGYYSDAITKDLEGEGTPPNPDDDTLPGHENATLVNSTSYTVYGGGLQAVNDWYNCGKSFYFEIKKMENGTLQSGRTLTFSLCGQNLNRPSEGGAEPEGDWNRLTARYILEFQTDTVIAYNKNDGTKNNVATITSLGDGWFGVKIAYNAFEINTGEYAMGNANETFTLCYINNIERSFKIG